MLSPASPSISVIVPTIGRPESLARLLDSLLKQTCAVSEVIVADAGDQCPTAAIIREPRFESLRVRHLSITPPNAVRQRTAAINACTGELLLLLDDDVELEPECVARMLDAMNEAGDVVAVTATFTNQSWPQPTKAWRMYLRCILGMKDNAWQGRVVGPLLRFGYNPVPSTPQPTEWLGAGNSLIRRSAYERAGGFSDFFLHRCTMNEDIDLSLKLSRLGRILFCPAARMAHHHASGGRVTPGVAAEDDLYNRYLVLRNTVGQSPFSAFASVTVFFLVESVGSFVGCISRMNLGGFFARFAGRVRALTRIVCISRSEAT